MKVSVERRTFGVNPDPMADRITITTERSFSGMHTVDTMEMSMSDFHKIARTLGYVATPATIKRTK